MIHIGRVLLFEFRFKRFIVLLALEVLVPAAFNSWYGICNSWVCPTPPL